MNPTEKQIKDKQDHDFKKYGSIYPYTTTNHNADLTATFSITQRDLGDGLFHLQCNQITMITMYTRTPEKDMATMHENIILYLHSSNREMSHNGVVWTEIDNEATRQYYDDLHRGIVERCKYGRENPREPYDRCSPSYKKQFKALGIDTTQRRYNHDVAPECQNGCYQKRCR